MQGRFHPLQHDNGAKPLHVRVVMEQPLSERLKLAHARHRQHQHEVGIAGDVVALLDLGAGKGLFHQLKVCRLSAVGMHLDHQGNYLTEFFRIDHCRVGLDKTGCLQALDAPLHGG
ncbi:hypothetical protein D3C75_903380 [compost metagenome]